MSFNRKPIDAWYTAKGKTYINSYIDVDEKYIESKYFISGTAEVSGVYSILFNDVVVYVGESGSMPLRIVTHLRNLAEKLTSWGIDPIRVENKEVSVKVVILHKGIVLESERLLLEEAAIERFQPALQMRLDQYYPYDKMRPGYKRSEISNDWCVCTKYRKEAVEAALGS